MRTALLTLGCSAALVVAGAPPSASSPPPYPNLYVASPDGSARADLGPAGSWSSFSWSPDGGAIAVGSDFGGIRIVWLDGGWRNLTGDHMDYDAAWSPSGEHIAFVRRDREGHTGLFLVEAGGGEPVPFADAPGQELAPSWSPDGTEVAYYHAPAGDDVVELRVAPADGSTARVAARGPIDTLHAPRWDPSGSRLLFGRTGPGGSLDVYSVGADGTGEHRITVSDADERDPSWSPDGSRVVFSTAEGIFVADAMGTETARLSERGTNPEWSPGGDRIAFDDGYDVMTIAPDGTDAREVAAAPWQRSYSPQWSPSGDAIAYLARWLDARARCSGIERNESKSFGGGGALVSGDDGDDTLRGTAFGDVVCAFDGDDTIDTGEGHDHVLAAAGGDVVFGRAGGDLLEGDGTGDFGEPARGAAGDDSLRGGRGRDRLVGGRGDDVLVGGRGRDRIVGGRGHDVCYAGRSDRVRGCETVRAGR